MDVWCGVGVDVAVGAVVEGWCGSDVGNGYGYANEGLLWWGGYVVFCSRGEVTYANDGDQKRDEYFRLVNIAEVVMAMVVVVEGFL